MDVRWCTRGARPRARRASCTSRETVDGSAMEALTGGRRMRLQVGFCRDVRRFLEPAGRNRERREETR